MRLLLFFVLCFGTAAHATILLNVEDPVDGDSVSGVRTIRGWAISDASPINRVEFWVNGERKSDAPYGGSRADVAAVHPTFPNADQSGFSFVYNFGRLGSGDHSLLFKAVADDDSSVEVSATVSVAAFPTAFISNPNQIMLDTLQDFSVLDPNSIMLHGATVEGEVYDLTVNWRTPDQNLDIVGIAPHTPLPEPEAQLIEAEIVRAKRPGETNYSSEFLGWGGAGTVVELENGDYWEQTDSTIRGFVCPSFCFVTIYNSAAQGSFIGWVWGDTFPVEVIKLDGEPGGGGFGG